jgi:methylenetetrahydrofolate dehydrogenase (NADP+)/methenyltetrahydrofolate cyclohydrolase
MIIDGRKISQEILEDLKKEVSKLSFKPVLIDVVVGSDAVTESYVSIKSKRAEEIGLEFQKVCFPETIAESELIAQLVDLQKGANVAGLLIQLPLPLGIDSNNVISTINPDLDVDGLTPENIGLMVKGTPNYLPATAAAIMEIIDRCNINLSGESVLVVGSGDLVGKPISFMLMNRQATITIANSQTHNLSELAKSAKVIICGAGSPNIITKDMISKDTVVIDAGAAESDGSITGDADFENIKDIALFITPVPGGVGPVTVAMLLKNTVISAKKISIGRSQ